MNLLELEKWQRDADLENLEGFRHGTRAAPTLYRTGTLKVPDGDAPMVFIASDDQPDRHGDIITVEGWDIEGYKANPVFLWLHGMDLMHLLPIGRVPKLWTEAKQLMAAVEWDDADPFAAEVRGKYRRGFLKAVSVGFRPLAFEEIKADGDGDGTTPDRDRLGIKFLKQELLELSAVPVPANPRALQRAKAWNLRSARAGYYSLPVTVTVPNNTTVANTYTFTAGIGQTNLHPQDRGQVADPLAQIASAIQELKAKLEAHE